MTGLFAVHFRLSISNQIVKIIKCKNRIKPKTLHCFKNMSNDISKYLYQTTPSRNIVLMKHICKS